MTSAELTKLLRSHGWRHVSTRGSHQKFVRPTTGTTVIVPFSKKDLATGTVPAILKQAKLK